MLYDKRWDKARTESDPFNIYSLIAWLEKQPEHQAYDYENCDGGCLLGLYMASLGFDWHGKVMGSKMRATFGDRGGQFKQAVYDHIARVQPWTFGAALSRARKAAGQ